MSDKEEKTSRSGIQVIARAAAILRTLGKDQTGLSLGQIAERVSLPRSTVQRIVGALQSEGFVISDGSGGGLRLGPAINSLSEAAQYNIVEHCRLLLTELVQNTGETADLSVQRGAGMIFLDQVSGTHHRLRTVSSVGEAFPLTTTANGRACLALMPEPKARKLILGEWERTGASGDLAAMLGRLEEIRATGLSHDLDEHTVGISAIGFAFRDWSGDLHAISVPVPSSRYRETRQLVERELRKTEKNVRKLMSVDAAA